MNELVYLSILTTYALDIELKLLILDFEKSTNLSSIHDEFLSLNFKIGFKVTLFYKL